MKRLSLFALAALLALALFAGCGKSGEETPDFEPETAAQALLDTDAFTDILSPIDRKVAASLYGVDAENISDCSVYCSTGATAEEIAIFRAVDAQAAQALETAAHTRLENQAAAYAGYGPEEVPKLEAADVRRAGCYVSCVVSEDAAAVAGVLDGYFK